MSYTANAPSNIALIKYMGKVDTAENKPTNASVSMSLPHLLSHVEIEPIDEAADRWEPLGEPSIQLSEKGKTRFLNHLARIKSQFEVDQSFLVRSANNFPSDCGLASSASSFAALTKGAVQAVCDIKGVTLPDLQRFYQSNLRVSCAVA